MALSDKNIIITPNIGAAADPKIVFSGADATTLPQNVTMQVYPSSNGTLSIDGSVGQMFSVTSSMTGTIFSVNDISGIPSIEVLDTGLVKIAQYNGNVTLGSTSSTTTLNGNVTTSTDATINGVKVGKGNSAIATNTAVGVSALNANTTGSRNTAVGYNALLSTQGGVNNTAIGASALVANTSGDGNNAFGDLALNANTSGANNTALGRSTLLSNTVGANNVASGNFALNANTGSDNVGTGYGALLSKVGGNGNVAIGFQAGRYSGATGTTALTSATNSIYIGQDSRGAAATGDSNSIVIGSSAVGLGSNTTVIGNSSTTQAKIFGALSAGADLTATSTTSIASGATVSGATKTLSIGTAGLTGSTTNINIGSTAGTSTTTINGSVTLAGASTNYAAVNIGIGYGAQVSIGNYAGHVQIGNGGDVTISAYTFNLNSIDNPIYIQRSGNGYGTSIGMQGDTATLIVEHDYSTINSITTFNKDVTVNGNLIINGTTTTINSNTVSVDDKNIELGGVVSTSPTGTVTAGSAVVTALTSTANIIPGSAVTALTGAGTITLPAGTTVASINSNTQITLSAALTGTGGPTTLVTLTITGATDVTANGGGITLKGTTDKTLTWNATIGWNSSEDFNLAFGKIFKINNVGVISYNSLGSGVTASSLTSVGTIATGVWQGTVVGPTYGGTGVNNGSNTLTLAGNVTHAGAFTQSFTATANTAVTLPTTGTLATLAGTETLTNKTLTDPTVTGTLTAATITASADATINGIKIGRGAGALLGNLAYGPSALASASLTGVANTAIGQESLIGNTSGANNLGLGYYTLRGNTTGSNNIALGAQSLRDNITGSNNVALGESALASNTNSLNIAIGTQCLNANTTGNNNVVLGYQGAYVLANGVTQVSNLTQSIFIGNNTRASTINDTNSIVIGHGAVGLGSNTTVIGNSSTTKTKLFGTLETTGDITVKAGSTTGSATITTPTTELVLSETGDQFGTSTLRIQNRNGMNGALFDNSASAIGCVDFGFKTRANNIDYQQLFRYEVRTAARSISIGAIGEFQVMGSAGLCANSDQTYVVPTTASTSTTTGALRVGGGAGIAGALNVGGIISDSKGDVRSSPINTQVSAYIALASDAGKTIYIATGGVTINASTFSTGDMLTIVNNSAVNQTITAGASVTFRLAGTASTGNRTLVQYGMATFLCVVGGATPTFHCSGAGLT